MFTLAEIRAAHNLVLATLRPTPSLSWPLLSQRLGTRVVVKHENHNPTGAFKVRGGLTYVDKVKQRGGGRGLISATRGNHARVSPSPRRAPASLCASMFRWATQSKKMPRCELLALS